MLSNSIVFDIRSLRAGSFHDVLAMIASSFERARAAPANGEGSATGLADKPSKPEIKMHAAQVGPDTPEQAADVFGFLVPRETLLTAQRSLDSMQGLCAYASMDSNHFRELASRWKYNQDPRAERDFRVFSAVICRLEKGQQIAPIKRDDIRLSAAGFMSKQDYEQFGTSRPLFTDMQIRVTLDDLQSRGLFTSVIYGKRHRFFSYTLSQTALAEAVLNHRAERESRKALKVALTKPGSITGK